MATTSTSPTTDTRCAAPAAAQSIQMRTHSYSHHLLNLRRAQAIDEGRGRFPVCRELNLALRRDLPEFLDELAIQSGWRAERLSESQLILEPPGALIECAGTRKRGYCSCWFQIWTSSVEHLNFLKVELMVRAGAALITRADVHPRVALPEGQQRACSGDDRRAGGRCALRSGVSPTGGRRERLHRAVPGRQGRGAGAARTARDGEDPAHPRHSRRHVTPAWHAGARDAYRRRFGAANPTKYSPVFSSAAPTRLSSRTPTICSGPGPTATSICTGS